MTVFGAGHPRQMQTLLRIQKALRHRRGHARELVESLRAGIFDPSDVGALCDVVAGVLAALEPEASVADGPTWWYHAGAYYQAKRVHGELRTTRIVEGQEGEPGWGLPDQLRMLTEGVLRAIGMNLFGQVIAAGMNLPKADQP